MNFTKYGEDDNRSEYCGAAVDHSADDGVSEAVVVDRIVGTEGD